MADGKTTIQLTEATKKRLDRIKPYESMSYEDIVSEMADVYEQTREVPAGGG